MPKEPMPRGGNPLPDSDNELARHAPEELMPSGVPEPDDQPMPSSALPPDNADLAHHVRSPPNNELARCVPEELTPSGVPEPDDQPTDLARCACTPLFLPDSRGPTSFAFSQSNFDDFCWPTPIPSRVPPEVDASYKPEDGEDDGDDDEETRSDLEFIDDEPVHQGSHFLIPEETNAAALEALAASFKAAPALSLDPSAVVTSTHDDSVLNLFQPNTPAPSDVPATLLPFKQTGESYLKKATFIGTAPALVEGVHIVVVAREHEGYVGYIIIIREIADRKHVARWAKIQENYNGPDTVHAKTPSIEAQILHLRRHALDPPTPFRVLDRIQVITGIEHHGAIGCIVQVKDKWLRVQCLPKSSEHNIIKVEYCRVTWYFMEGDFVCVTSGPTDHHGLVVKVCMGGALELYSVMPSFIAEDTNYKLN
ncbi:hypothetical protein DFH08DRAFT_804391 [Mycena albidolilacea]|uniref:Uncharacterized protein n=1 Tax=Mycena albidolilacea TaxID=1033008 RepID=A0AAD7EVP8_9AGAR|nr:hypothetical protein DFH08DRAFT_804391 [Mycena albidolilacea]